MSRVGQFHQVTNIDNNVEGCSSNSDNEQEFCTSIMLARKECRHNWGECGVVGLHSGGT
jgi:hypothetical protein